jgi:glycosyltransferase involved in cell wall biosynthesis
MRCRFVVLTPVLDDWSPLRQLISKIDRQCSADDVTFEIVAVDDGSADPCDAETLTILPSGSCIKSVSIIRLALNLGRQRAIAVGLASLADSRDIDGAIVMDSDGEDRPAATKAPIATWDRFMIPLSSLLDPISGYRLGKSAIIVWQR